MQIETVHKLQNALDTSMKVLRFIWRHILTLIAVTMIIYGICDGKTPIIARVTTIFTAVVFIDWIKMKIRLAFTNIHYNIAQEQMFDSARRSRDDFSWKMNPLNPMGYTHHSHNSSNYY